MDAVQHLLIHHHTLTVTEDRKAELERIIRARTEEIRRLTKENARDADELRTHHDAVSWLTFLASTMEYYEG